MMISPGCTHTSNAFKDAHFAQVHQRRQHIEHLEDQITELAAHVDAAMFCLLELVREYDECEGWGGKGLISCAHWLNWKCGIDLGTAREKVRVAHALKDLPQISEEFRLGRVSYSKVRAMTRVATPKNEDYLLMIARHGTAVHVERLVRNYRQVKRIEALDRENSRHAQRELHWYVDDEGLWVLRGRLPAEQGALVQTVLEQAMEEDFREQQGVPAGISSTQPLDEIHSHPEPISMRRADALVRMAQRYSSEAKGNSGDRFTVHVHTDMETLKQEGTGGEAELEDVGNICAETARRVSCDAGIVHWLENSIAGQAGVEPLSIGRKSRSIPPAIRRALQRRDGGCRFPGCTHTHFVDAHHIQHWADGGDTAMENLVLLCRHHHRLVHEGGFGLNRSADRVVEFTNPAGEVIPPGPARNSRGNIWSLFEQHSASGIRITPKTAQSQWLGEKMDDDMAIQVMLQLE
ncbi:MAG: HNH endonuclease [Xanthomonadales bacterium]|nr:HNH endonuclease [Xanthomonadales bacterium]